MGAMLFDRRGKGIAGMARSYKGTVRMRTP